jgi:hypothetical protein
MESALFDQIRQTLDTQGPAAAIDQLCSRLRESQNYSDLFYALLVRTRHELGAAPIPTGPSADMPAHLQGPYEDAIRDAAREVGRLFLQRGQIPHAWAYFRMIGEPEPVKQGLEHTAPGPDEDIQPLIDIAYYQAVHPRKGFDLILDRYGICNAITAVSNPQIEMPADVRDHCLRRLVRSLHAELVGRLRAAVEKREDEPSAQHTVHGLLTDHPWLRQDEFPHIDTSHLSAVVQMSLYLTSDEDLALARELCEYGQSLPAPFQHRGDPPFEDFFHDHDVYLSALTGNQPDKTVAHFREKITGAGSDQSRPAEVLVNLLLRLDRPKEALALAREYLAQAESSSLTCPGLPELCQRAGDYAALAEVARQNGDPVHFLAGLLADRSKA